jgi:hypothetical protein
VKLSPQLEQCAPPLSSMKKWPIPLHETGTGSGLAVFRIGFVSGLRMCVILAPSVNVSALYSDSSTHG